MLSSTRRWMHVVLLGLAIVAAPALMAGCGGDGGDGGGGGEEATSGEQVEGRFVGKSGDTFVAVLTAGGNVTAYACNGTTVAERFDGKADGTSADLTSKKGARLRLRLSDEEATGTLTVEGEEPVSFTAEPAKGKAGYYAARRKVDGRELRLGWVALNNGEWRGGVTQPPNVQPAGELSGDSLAAGLCPPNSVCDLCKVAPTVLGRRCAGGTKQQDRVQPEPQPTPSASGAG